MTNRPFHPPKPSDDDVNTLNSLLDAMASGKRAPKADSASDADAMAATARLVSGHPAADETPSEQTLDAIWRTVMQSRTLPAQAPFGFYKEDNSVKPRRIHELHAPAETNRFGSLLTFAAVALLLIGLIGAAFGLRGFQNGGNEPPPIRLAAVTLPGGDEVQIEYRVPTAADCTVEPLTVDEVMAKLSEAQGSIHGGQDRSKEDAVATAKAEFETPSANTPDTSEQPVSSFPKGQISPLTEEAYNELAGRHPSQVACLQSLRQPVPDLGTGKRHDDPGVVHE